MTTVTRSFIITFLITVALPGYLVAASVPSADITSVASSINRAFVTVDDLRLLPAGSGISDIVVIGQARGRHRGTRVQIYGVRGDKTPLRWDSLSLYTAIEFNMGPGNIKIEKAKDNFILSFSGCAQHACFDGILGFLVYSGRAEKAYTAKLTTIDAKDGKTIRYSVEWSPSYDTSAEGIAVRRILERNICGSDGISDSNLLPFRCPHQ